MSRYEDVQTITALPHRYCGGVNRADPDAVTSCFAEDAVWTFDTPGDDGQIVPVRYEGIEAVGSFIRNAVAATAFIQQLIGVVDIVDLEGDGGHLYTHFEVRLRFATGGSLYVIAVFDDQVARFPQGWLFTQRAGTTVYWDRAPLAGTVGSAWR
jgi:hypothetical protein